MKWTKVICICLVIIEPLLGIELLHNHAMLQMPGHLYMHKRETCSIACQNYDMTFYVTLNTHLDIEPDIDLILDLLNRTCTNVPQDEECYQLRENLLIEQNGLEIVTENMERMHSDLECRGRSKRSAQAFEPYFPFQYRKTYQFSEEKIIIAMILNGIKTIGESTTETSFKEKNEELFRLLEKITKLLKKAKEFNQHLVDILCDENLEALLNVITVDAMQNRIETINKYATADSCNVPKAKNTLDLVQLLELSNIHTTFVDNTLSIDMKIPTIQTNIYGLFQVISLPFSYKNQSYVVMPASPFYLISENIVAGTTFMYTMTSEETNECNNTTFGCICQPKTSLQVTKAFDKQTENLPEIEECTNKTPEEIFKKRNECEIFYMPHANRILQITSNIYFSYIMSPTTMSIICPKHSENITMKESKMITVHPECSLKLAPNVQPESDEIFMKKENFAQLHNKTIYSTKSIEEKEHDLGITYATLTICFSILLIATWIIVGYNNRRFLEQLSRFATNWQTNRGAHTALDFDCSFTFVEPPALPKRTSNKQRFIETEVEYDEPRHTIASTSAGSPYTKVSKV